MVAATKMRKAQYQALSSRPYAETLQKSLEYLLPSTSKDAHPLLNVQKAGSIGVLLLSTDRSLCGSLNTNLFKKLFTFFKEHKEELIFYTVGKKGRQFVVKVEKTLDSDFENHEGIVFKNAARLGKVISSSFFKAEVGEVYLAYQHFTSTLVQEPVITRLLPIIAENGNTTSQTGEFLFEPTPDYLLQYVLSHAVEAKIYQALLEAKASEHSARMIAMQNATNNARELVEDLSLSYNQVRQESITRELLEITSANLAME